MTTPNIFNMHDVNTPEKQNVFEFTYEPHKIKRKRSNTKCVFAQRVWKEIVRTNDTLAPSNVFTFKRKLKMARDHAKQAVFKISVTIYAEKCKLLIVADLKKSPFDNYAKVSLTNYGITNHPMFQTKLVLSQKSLPSTMASVLLDPPEKDT